MRKRFPLWQCFFADQIALMRAQSRRVAVQMCLEWLGWKDVTALRGDEFAARYDAIADEATMGIVLVAHYCELGQETWEAFNGNVS